MSETAQPLLKRLESLLDYKPPDWIWPAALFALGAIAVGMTLLFDVTSPTQVTFLGRDLQGTCSFLEQTGFPCPSCGMTRSWIHSSQGHILTGMIFNPAGALLFWWLVVAGILGGLRLVTGNYALLKTPNLVLAGWAVFWMLVPYTAFWLMRISMGINPLPELMP